jgi:NTE family protein
VSSRAAPGAAVLALLVCLTPLSAAPRPRIGLVLSGGGALGVAHVGVLQELEAMHVPVDVVAGTSMGAIVGGLYAAGYSPADLEALVESLDWNDLLIDRPDRRRMPFRRKVDDLTYLTRYEFGFSGGRLRMPSGFIAGQRLGVALEILSLRAAGITEFDHLPLPFRAVATDLDTGEMVVLARGDLATAMRASMAVPGVFSPVEVNGRLLADGGLVRNLPVDVARAMGADIVIAVDLGEPLAAGRRPDSIASVIQRTAGMLTRLNVETSLRDADIVIRPQVSAFGLLEFGRAREIVPRGREAARAVAQELAVFAVGPDEWEAHLACQRRGTSTLRVRQVSVDPGPGQPPALVSRLVRTRPGRPLDLAVLQGDLERLYDVGEFETVDFHLEPMGDEWGVAIAAHPKPWGPNFLRFGLALSSDLEGTSDFNALADFTMTRLNRYGAEFKTWAQLGVSPSIGGEFYQPLESSRTLFGAVQVQGGQLKEQVPVGGETVQYRISLRRAQVALGAQLGRFGEVRLGVRRDETEGVPTSSHGSDAPRFNRTDGGLVADLTIDQFDNANFPRHGVLAFVEAYETRAALGAETPYRRLDLQTYAAATWRRHTVLGFVRATSALGGALPPGQDARLGGLFNLSGLPPGELAGSYGGVAGLIYLYRFGQLPTLGGMYAGFSLEAGNLWARSRDATLDDLRHSYSLAVGLDTALGPVYLAHGVTTGGKDSFYLLVGRTF